jgi:uncharacterized protein (TIGR03067 family)
MSATTCPSREELFDYAVGRLSDQASHGVAEHLESCELCQAGLATFDDADDTLVARLRQPPEEDPYLGESQCQVAVARFEREMKAIGRLDHPNIVRAYDAREIEGKPVLIMEYVEGLDLGKLVRRLGPLPVADACELARQAALGLQYAHENGLVHRDVKPSNLMLTPQGEVKILDLGLARFHRSDAGSVADVEGGVAGAGARVAGVERSSPPASRIPGRTSDDMTGSGLAMGTADYMAPEQASDSHAVDIRADIYSLACTLYKLLTARAPFGGPEYKGSFEKMTAHVQEPVPPIRQLDPEIPENLAAVLDRMLAKEPDERFATPQEVAESLAPFSIDCDLPGLLVRGEEAEAAAAEPPGYPLGAALPRQPAPGAVDTPATPLPFWRRKKLVAAAIALMLLSVGAGIALGIIITIHRNGKTTSVEVADGSSVNIDKQGNLSVTPPRESGKPAPSAAKSDFEAIQGTWAVVSASTGTGAVYPLVTPARSGLTEEDLVATKVVITSDALKVQGKNVVSFTFKYQLNPSASPRMIDLQTGGRVLWGIYELSGDQLKICTTDASTPPRLPTRFWAGYQSGDELVVLRRVGDAFITADEKAIQGSWEIVSSETNISESAKTGASAAASYMWPSGDAATGRIVQITRHAFRLKVPSAGLGGGEEQGKEYGYAIDPSTRLKTIDFTFSRVYPGVYELDCDQLRICASIALFGGSEDRRPKSIPAKPGEGQVLIVLRRLSQAAAAAAGGKPSTGAEAAPPLVVQIQVAKSGEVRIGPRQVQVSVDASAPWLAALRQLARRRALRVEVQCDPEAAYGPIARLIDAVKAAGVKDVSIRTESTPMMPARLDFRIAATRTGKGGLRIAEDDIQRYLHDLQALGPNRQRMSPSPFRWFEVQGDAAPELITGAYHGRPYVLLANTPKHVMLAEQDGKRTWGLEAVHLERDPQGNPAIGIDFDQEGQKRLAAPDGVPSGPAAGDAPERSGDLRAQDQGEAQPPGPDRGPFRRQGSATDAPRANVRYGQTWPRRVGGRRERGRAGRERPPPPSNSPGTD